MGFRVLARLSAGSDMLLCWLISLRSVEIESSTKFPCMLSLPDCLGDGLFDALALGLGLGLARIVVILDPLFLSFSR